MEHEFTSAIRRILRDHFGDEAGIIYERGHLLRYINYKSSSASRGSKARASFASQYALYVLVEDYVAKGFVESGDYADYEGAQFSALSTRQRELPFGEKLQNHALNHRVNEDFSKLFPDCELRPIVRHPQLPGRYWVNQELLLVEDSVGERRNIARAVVAIIAAYVEAKRGSFIRFIADCRRRGASRSGTPPRSDSTWRS